MEKVQASLVFQPNCGEVLIPWPFWLRPWASMGCFNSTPAVGPPPPPPDATTKESLGWAEVIPGVKSGTISCECLTDYSDTLNFEQLADMVLTKEKATFVFKDNVNPKLIVRGEGFVSSVDETAQFETATSFNLEINLTGVFTITDPSEGRTWENIFEKWEDISDNWEDV